MTDMFVKEFLEKPQKATGRRTPCDTNAERFLISAGMAKIQAVTAALRRTNILP